MCFVEINISFIIEDDLKQNPQFIETEIKTFILERNRTQITVFSTNKKVECPERIINLATCHPVLSKSLTKHHYKCLRNYSNKVTPSFNYIFNEI